MVTTRWPVVCDRCAALREVHTCSDTTTPPLSNGTGWRGRQAGGAGAPGSRTSMGSSSTHPARRVLLAWRADLCWEGELQEAALDEDAHEARLHVHGEQAAVQEAAHRHVQHARAAARSLAQAEVPPGKHAATGPHVRGTRQRQGKRGTRSAAKQGRGPRQPGPRRQFADHSSQPVQRKHQQG